MQRVAWNAAFYRAWFVAALSFFVLGFGKYFCIRPTKGFINLVRRKQEPITSIFDTILDGWTERHQINPPPYQTNLMVEEIFIFPPTRELVKDDVKIVKECPKVYDIAWKADVTNVAIDENKLRLTIEPFADAATVENNGNAEVLSKSRLSTRESGRFTVESKSEMAKRLESLRAGGMDTTTVRNIGQVKPLSKGTAFSIESELVRKLVFLKKNSLNLFDSGESVATASISFLLDRTVTKLLVRYRYMYVPEVTERLIMEVQRSKKSKSRSKGSFKVEVTCLLSDYTLSEAEQSLCGFLLNFRSGVKGVLPLFSKETLVTVENLLTKGHCILVGMPRSVDFSLKLPQYVWMRIFQHTSETCHIAFLTQNNENYNFLCTLEKKFLPLYKYHYYWSVDGHKFFDNIKYSPAADFNIPNMLKSWDELLTRSQSASSILWRLPDDLPKEVVEGLEFESTNALEFKFIAVITDMYHKNGRINFKTLPFQAVSDELKVHQFATFKHHDAKLTSSQHVFSLDVVRLPSKTLPRNELDKLTRMVETLKWDLTSNRSDKIHWYFWINSLSDKLYLRYPVMWMGRLEWKDYCIVDMSEMVQSSFQRPIVSERNYNALLYTHYMKQQECSVRHVACAEALDKDSVWKARQYNSFYILLKKFKCQASKESFIALNQIQNNSEMVAYVQMIRYSRILYNRYRVNFCGFRDHITHCALCEFNKYRKLNLAGLTADGIERIHISRSDISFEFDKKGRMRFFLRMLEEK